MARWRRRLRTSPDAHLDHAYTLSPGHGVCHAQQPSGKLVLSQLDEESRAVSQPSAPSAVVARQRMQADPPMHLEANGDTSRSRGGVPLRAPTREEGCTVCRVNVHITAPAMCDGLVPETCCFFVKSARYPLSCERDDAYCDMKLSRKLAETTCRRNLTHTISRTRIFTGIPICKHPSIPAGGFSCTHQWFGGGTRYVLPP